MSQACAEWRGELGAYIVGALDWQERAGLRRHLEACPACRTEYEDLLPVRYWLARLAVCHTDRPPAWRLRIWPGRS